MGSVLGSVRFARIVSNFVAALAFICATIGLGLAVGLAINQHIVYYDGWWVLAAFVLAVIFLSISIKIDPDDVKHK